MSRKKHRNRKYDKFLIFIPLCIFYLLYLLIVNFTGASYTEYEQESDFSTIYGSCSIPPNLDIETLDNHTSEFKQNVTTRLSNISTECEKIHVAEKTTHSVPRVVNSSDIIIIQLHSNNYKGYPVETVKYLKDQFNAVNFQNYQTLGDTYADNMALLSGALTVPLSKHLLGSKETELDAPQNYDVKSCYLLHGASILPETFGEIGYATLIAEENSSDDYPFYLSSHCKWQPTHSFRMTDRVSSNVTCVHAPRILNFTSRFMEQYEGSSKFALLRITHSDRVVDEVMVDFLKRNKEQLSTSYVFMIFDLPKRSALSMPSKTLVMSVPKAHHGSLSDPLKAQKDALITPFDVHATLRGIANLPSSDRGSSLLAPLRYPRDCVSLPIPLQYCPCPLKSTEYTDTAIRFAAAEAALLGLNELLEQRGGLRWDIEKIHSVKRIEVLSLIEVILTVRPEIVNATAGKYDIIDYPVLKLTVYEQRLASGFDYKSLPDLSIAIKPVDSSLSTCIKGHWLRPFYYCTSTPPTDYKQYLSVFTMSIIIFVVLFGLTVCGKVLRRSKH